MLWGPSKRNAYHECMMPIESESEMYVHVYGKPRLELQCYNSLKEFVVPTARLAVIVVLGR